MAVNGSNPKRPPHKGCKCFHCVGGTGHAGTDKGANLLVIGDRRRQEASTQAIAEAEAQPDPESRSS